MSERITHVAIHDDCRNLAIFSADTLPEIKQSLQKHLRVGRLGAVTSRGDRDTIDLLQESKKAWPSDEAERMLAFFFGWRSHIAADRQLKSLFRLLEPEVYITEAIDGPTSISIYQDLFILNELYAEEDKQNPFPRDLLAPNHASGPLENIFAGLWQNSLLGLHAFATHSQPSEPWFEQFLAQHQKFYVDTARYTEAYSQLDPEKMRFVVETNRFYNRADPLIQITQRLRQGKQPDSPIDLATALATAKDQSHYARALRRGWLYLQATTAFWQGDIDLEELQSQFEVDEPHTKREVFGNLQNDQRRQALLQEWHETSGE